MTVESKKEVSYYYSTDDFDKFCEYVMDYAKYLARWEPSAINAIANQFDYFDPATNTEQTSFMVRDADSKDFTVHDGSDPSFKFSGPVPINSCIVILNNQQSLDTFKRFIFFVSRHEVEREMLKILGGNIKLTVEDMVTICKRHYFD